MVWQLVGTPSQNAIVQSVLNRCDFPFGKLLPGLRQQTGRSTIPVEWADLSRYGAIAAEDAQTRHHSDEVHIDGDTAIKILDKARSRVLGLAWYSGKITIEQTLESNPELAGEVWISEGAHMVDFFYMTDEHRIAVWNAVHPDHQHIPPGTNIEDGVDLGHGHGWFDMATYREWVGEEFMGLFVKAFSDFPLTINFAHTWDADAREQVRYALVPEFAPQPEPPVVDPEPTPVPPEEPIEPEPETPDEPGTGDAPFRAKSTSGVFHDRHTGFTTDLEFATFADAVNSGRRPCGVCKPSDV